MNIVFLQTINNKPNHLVVYRREDCIGTSPTVNGKNHEYECIRNIYENVYKWQKHMKKYRISLAIKEMYTKYTLTKIAKFKNST